MVILQAGAGAYSSPYGSHLTVLADLPDLDPKEFKRMEAIISSMTMKERENVEMIDMSRQPHRRQPTRLPDPWDSPGITGKLGGTEFPRAGA